MNNLSFMFNQATIRTIIKEGEPWFVATDICRVLGYGNASKTTADHCKSPVTLKYNESLELKVPSGGLIIIPERDLYRLIMRSKLPSAERFEEWVVSEVLPQLRKTGSVSIVPVKEPQPVQAVPTTDNTMQIHMVQAALIGRQAEVAYLETVLVQLGASPAQAPLQLTHKTRTKASDHLSVGEFTQLQGMKPDWNLNASIGNRAAAILRSQDLKPAKNKWKGTRVNFYPKSVLQQVYESL
jgi:prophage antirepressor-like protein